MYSSRNRELQWSKCSYQVLSNCKAVKLYPTKWTEVIVPKQNNQKKHICGVGQRSCTIAALPRDPLQSNWTCPGWFCNRQDSFHIVSLVCIKRSLSIDWTTAMTTSCSSSVLSHITVPCFRSSTSEHQDFWIDFLSDFISVSCQRETFQGSQLTHQHAKKRTRSHSDQWVISHDMFNYHI